MVSRLPNLGSVGKCFQCLIWWHSHLVSFLHFQNNNWDQCCCLLDFPKNQSVFNLFGFGSLDLGRRWTGFWVICDKKSRQVDFGYQNDSPALKASKLLGNRYFFRGSACQIDHTSSFDPDNSRRRRPYRCSWMSESLDWQIIISLFSIWFMFTNQLLSLRSSRKSYTTGIDHFGI